MTSLRRHLALVLLALITLTACETPRPPQPAAAPVEIAPFAAARVAVDFRPHSQWTTERMAKIRDAARLLETVLNQPAFAQAVAARRDFERNEGFSSGEILHLLRAGLTLADVRRGAVTPRAITLALAISPAEGEFSKDDGFTDLDTLIIYVRRDWLDNQPLCAVANLLAHEHMHVMGFTHTTFNHPWRHRSVPYAIGDMVARHAQPDGCKLK